MPLALYRMISGAGSTVRLHSMVNRVEWSQGQARVYARSPWNDREETLVGRAVVVTVPLGVLQASPDGRGAIRFDPEPVEALGAARTLCCGQAVRVTLRFDRAFWADCEELGDASILLSDEPLFPTWWTSSPVQAPVIVGWSAGSKAQPLLGRPRDVVVGEALASLRRITGRTPARLENAWFHDWQTDPLTRCAYSYVPAGGLPVRRLLEKPVGATLFFAGEATDTSGHTGTVHGAMASGARAAAQVRRALNGSA